jgi:protein O-GlcNAc transferase
MLRDANQGAGAIGISEHYNKCIEALIRANADPETIIIFSHDDVYIHDWNIGLHLAEGLRRFELLGPIGCQKALSNQPGWASTLNERGRHMFLGFEKIRPSGSINHCDYLRIIPEVFLPIGVSCDLLDGCFMAIRLRTLLKYPNLRFDQQFRFHCYDSDFCRQALQLGLRVGSWPIHISHQSGGSFRDEWAKAAMLFQKKWGHVPIKRQSGQHSEA